MCRQEIVTGAETALAMDAFVCSEKIVVYSGALETI